MRRLIALLCGCLLMMLSASAAIEYDWQEGEAWFPQEKDWTYHYAYRYPVAKGDSESAQAVNYYFDNALYEMTKLVLPMYAADPVMAAGQQHEFCQDYAVTCNSDDHFSFLMTQRQTVEGRELVSLSSAVFALSGEYAGQTLTLRGLVQVGDSSAQLAELVRRDIWRQIEARMTVGETAWKQGINLEKLTEEFYPENQFYADEKGRAVFYLQPGEFRDDLEVVTFTYAPQDLLKLL